MALVQGDQREDCCKIADNLEHTRIDESRAVNVCKVCGRRHFEITVDPIGLGIKGVGMGGE